MDRAKSDARKADQCSGGNGARSGGGQSPRQVPVADPMNSGGNGACSGGGQSPRQVLVKSTDHRKQRQAMTGSEKSKARKRKDRKQRKKEQLKSFGSATPGWVPNPCRQEAGRRARFVRSTVRDFHEFMGTPVPDGYQRRPSGRQPSHAARNGMDGARDLPDNNLATGH